MFSSFLCIARLLVSYLTWSNFEAALIVEVIVEKMLSSSTHERRKVFCKTAIFCSKIRILARLYYGK